MEQLPAIDSLQTASIQSKQNVLSLLFEPSPALNTIAVPILDSQTFTSYPTVIDVIGEALKQLNSKEDLAQLDEVLSSHPRLGEKKVDSALSRAEQAAMNKASTSTGSMSADEEARILQNLNQKYEETFPGLRYVVFVNGRARTVIFEDMVSRIAQNDISKERLNAIEAMCEIAKDRAKKLQH